ncbi:acyl-CoA dehydrogenase family protein [bacterium]|nr:acyl-CoA dehydrogenase family protein [bacterium]
MIKNVKMNGYLKGLFSGKIYDEYLFPYPSLKNEEKEIVLSTINTINRFYNSTKKGNSRDFFKSLGIFSLLIPQEYGGVGVSFSSFLHISEAIAKNSFSDAIRVGIEVVMGTIPILLYGNEFIKKRYLSKISSGDLKLGFALTEFHAGSDIRSIDTYAEYIPQQKKYRITGKKVWIFLGIEADSFIVLAKMKKPKADKNRDELSIFLINRADGIESGKAEKLNGLNELGVSELYFNEIEIPESQLLGEEGDGFQIAVNILNFGRLELATETLGVLKKITKISTEYALQRKQFGQTISEYGLIQEKICSMVKDTYILESMLYLTAAFIDAGADEYAIEAAVCKIFGSESLISHIDNATKICSGVSFLATHELSKLLRESRMIYFFQGTNDILTLFTAYSGLHKDIDSKKELSFLKALTEPLKSLSIFSDILVHKISAATVGNDLDRVNPILKKEKDIFIDLVQKFSFTIEVILKRTERDILKNQFFLKKISQTITKLYSLSSVLSRTSDAIKIKGSEHSIQYIELTNRIFLQEKEDISKILDDLLEIKEDDRDSIIRNIYKHKGYPFDLI